MLRECDDQIHIAYGVCERSILNCILVTFKDKINYQMECGVHFYSITVIENDIKRVSKILYMIQYLEMLSYYHIGNQKLQINYNSLLLEMIILC